MGKECRQLDTFKNLTDDIYLSMINLAGTHDSCTAFVTMENMARCQSLTIKEQLASGIRLFDIRLNKSGDEFYLIHSLADCFIDEGKTQKLTFSDVLGDFEQFLKENPGESLIVSVKQDRGIMSRNFFPAFYEKYIKGNEGKWWLKNEEPTVGDIRGKMVLMRRCKVWRSFYKSTDAGLDFSHWPDQKFKSRMPKAVVISRSHRKNEDHRLVAVVQDRYTLPPEVKWKECAKPFLDECITGEGMFALHYISTSYRKKGDTLVETAKAMNGYFGEYEMKTDRAQGWFFLDFPTRELCEKIIKSNLEIYKEKVK